MLRPQPDTHVTGAHCPGVRVALWAWPLRKGRSRRASDPGPPVAVRVRAPGDRRDDAHCAREPQRPVSGPPSRYDAKAEVNR